MSKSKIAVIGAGLMGHGIAYIFAAAGNRVSIYDPDKLALSSVVGRISEIFEDEKKKAGDSIKDPQTRLRMVVCARYT